MIVALPIPVPGLVIRYAFLWRDEAARGIDEGAKDRPCAVVLVTQSDLDPTSGEHDLVVTVLPITHMPPAEPKLAVEVPAATKRRLGLDDNRSWIVVTDANRFVWPGPDLRFSIAGETSSCSYGLLPRGLFNEMREKFVAAVKASKSRAVKRTR